LIGLEVERPDRFPWLANAPAVVCPDHDRRGGAVVAFTGEPLTTTAVVADELALARAGIAAVLDARGIGVVGESRSGRELVSLATVERPDLAIVGSPADLDTADVVRRLVRLRPHPEIVVLVPPAQEHLVRYVLAMGATGVALRSVEAEELGVVVDSARKGERHVAPGLHYALAGDLKLPALDERTADVLTTREREVLALLAEGRDNREISSALSVTLATTKSHLARIYAKLEAKNRNDAVARAVSLGLLR
jgi:DNA-binding NarL/FixJ family response regulator